MKSFCTLLLLLFLPVLLNSQALKVGSGGDFGDAPDGTKWWGGTANFPTLSTNQGPLHYDAQNSTFWIGDTTTRGANTTTTELEANVVDNDLDDGQPFIFIMLTGIPAPANITIPITTSSSHDPNTDIYVNVAIDVDGDLDFNDNPDVNWVVQNQVVHCPADTTLGFDFGPFGFGNDLILLPVWVRITVTNEYIDPPWDGKGLISGWSVGETEDWWFTSKACRGHNARAGKNAPGANNPNPKPKPQPKPNKSKCIKLKYPRHIYVKCEQTKCIRIGVRDCGSEPVSNIKIDFNLIKGTPLTTAPHTVGAPVKIGNTTWFLVCATGWPCESEEELRYAKYKIKVKYDPDGIYVEKDFIMEFGNDQFPFGLDENNDQKLWLAAESVDTTGFTPWFGAIGKNMNKKVWTWQGKYPRGIDWLGTGQPRLSVVSAPSWSTFTLDGRDGSTSATYTFDGTPLDADGGLEYLVLSVESDDPHDNFDPWIWEIPIYIDGDNHTPVFDLGLESDYNINIANGDSIDIAFIKHDDDLLVGRRDTTFFDWFLWDKNKNDFYDDANVELTDNGDETGTLKWKPDINDLGDYNLVLQTWDYYLSMDSSLANVKVFNMNADFNADYIVGFAPSSVTFSDLSVSDSITITSYNWDFGDGEFSTEHNPVHTYSHSGTYTVKLTVSNDTIQDEEIKNSYIVVNDVGFKADTTYGEPPLLIHFENTTTEELPLSITSSTTSSASFTWAWDFGDGDLSSQKEPVHTYTEAGVYTVSLTSTIHLSETTGTITTKTDIKSQTIEKRDYILIYGPLVADFVADFTEGYSPLSISFTDLSTGSPSAWKWNFGDNSSEDTLQSPIHIYTNPGLYNVSLTIFRGADEDYVMKNSYILVKQAVQADFTVDTTSGFAPLTVNFKDNSIGDPGPISWDWIFGDGLTGKGNHIAHTYTSAGVYDVILIVNNGDMSDTLKKANLITVIEKTDSLKAEFRASPLKGDKPLTVLFTDLSQGNPTSWSWVFGDDSTSTLQNPTHLYNNSGTFTVTLTISDSSNQNSETKENYIIVTTPINVNDYLEKSFKLYQNYPNPLINSTNIRFTLQTACVISLKVYNVLGNEIKTLINSSYKNTGDYTVLWDGSDNIGRALPAGLYYYELTIQNNSLNTGKTKGMLIIR